TYTTRSPPSTRRKPTASTTSPWPPTSKDSSPPCTTGPTPQPSKTANASYASSSTTSSSAPTTSPSDTASRSTEAQPATPTATCVPTRRVTIARVIDCVGGVIIPPWGVPVSVSSRSPSAVIIPAFRNSFTNAQIRLSLILTRRRSINAVCEISSKQDLMSASSTQWYPRVP